jgi:hypothetical protein
MSTVPNVLVPLTCVFRLFVGSSVASTTNRHRRLGSGRQKMRSLPCRSWR